MGGGITGIISAYLLAKQGVKATFIEADETLIGTTGHTTAKSRCSTAGFTTNLLLITMRNRPDYTI
ncbi:MULTISPECIES: NAD(P)-binding protein [Peribacillus]|uniref:NAD(P)-binding protein n=1 Tax=Peribacillus TaxID=2675229 RepID=UPI001F4D7A83|nr:hypothetical protein [Peribacillus sp. Aquil_B1]MCK2007122.1 hypothetical protein [Peribacillus sp. Aquil_B8]